MSILDFFYKFCAIDEAGNLGLTKDSSKYFLLSCFLHNDDNLERKIRKFIGSLNHNKSEKKINILHAKHDTDKTKIKLIRFLKTFDWRCLVVVCKKTKLVNNHLDKLLDYHQMLNFALSSINITENIFVSSPVNKFNFHEKTKSISNQIRITTMANHNVLQLADSVASAVFKKYEYDDSLYFDLLKDKIQIVNYEEKKKNP